MIWKVFAMPSRLILSGGRPVISRPRKTTRPAFGAYRPETTLKSVDLPAPFGPMTEKTWPWDTAKPTRLSAASAPKFLETPSTSRITPPAAIEGAPWA